MRRPPPTLARPTPAAERGPVSWTICPGGPRACDGGTPYRGEFVEFRHSPFEERVVVESETLVLNAVKPFDVVHASKQLGVARSLFSFKERCSANCAARCDAFRDSQAGVSRQTPHHREVLSRLEHERLALVIGFDPIRHEADVVCVNSRLELRDARNEFTQSQRRISIILGPINRGLEHPDDSARWVGRHPSHG